MKALEMMALDEINKNSSVIDAKLYDAKANLLAVKQTLMHCDHGMSKESITELMTAIHKAVASIDESKASGVLIGQWSNSLKEV